MSHLSQLSYDELLKERCTVETRIAFLERSIFSSTKAFKKMLTRELQSLADLQKEISAREHAYLNDCPLETVYRDMGLRFCMTYSARGERMAIVSPDDPLNNGFSFGIQCYLTHIETLPTTYTPKNNK